MCDTSIALVRSLVIWDHTYSYLPLDRGDSHAFTPSILPVLICRPRKDERLS